LEGKVVWDDAEKTTRALHKLAGYWSSLTKHGQPPSERTLTDGLEAVKRIARHAAAKSKKMASSKLAEVKERLDEGAGEDNDDPSTDEAGNSQYFSSIMHHKQLLTLLKLYHRTPSQRTASQYLLHPPPRRLARGRVTSCHSQ